MPLYQSGIRAFEIGEKVEVVVPESNRKYNPPELKLKGKVGVVRTKPYADRTIDVSFNSGVITVMAAWLRRVKS